MPYARCVAAYIENPRRSPRIRIDLPASIAYGSTTFLTLAVDVGRGGCQLSPPYSLSVGTPVSIALTAPPPCERFKASGTIAWVGRARCGVAFQPGQERTADPDYWFRQLLLSDPGFPSLAARTPSKLSLDAQLTSVPVPLSAGSLPIDERLVLSQLRERRPLRAVAMETRMHPDRFARALFALLERGLVVTA